MFRLAKASRSTARVTRTARRNMSDHWDPKHAEHEMDKWKKISFAAMPVVVAYTVYTMATLEHGHHNEVRLDTSTHTPK